MADRNPYVIGVPLTDDVAFYGRQEFFTFIRDVLDAEKQNVIVLYGQRRIGKTSLLYRAAKWLETNGPFSPVYYDLQGKERMSLGEVLENLAQTLARRLELPKPDAALFDEAGSYFSDQFLPRAFQRLGGKHLVLFVDEFDVLSDELESPRAASKTLFPYLQALIVTQPQIGFVFVVGRRIEELATQFQAIFKQAVYRRVGLLRPEESRALIVEPVGGMIAYDDDAVQCIQSLTAGHPYFTQLICFEVFNAAKAGGKKRVTKGVVEMAVSSAIESGHGALNWFWEGLPRAERFTLAAVAQASDPSGVASKDAIRRLLEEHHVLFSGLELQEAPDRLVDWEMLRREGPDAYQFVVEIVRRWVLEAHPLSSARRDIDYVSRRAVRLYENARDAHAEGDLPYAREDYRRTLRANPNHSGAQLGLALVLFELGEIDEAVTEFERAYAIDEMSARDGLVRARLAKAKECMDAVDVDGAAVQYEKILRIAAGEETATQRMAAIWQSRAEAALRAGDLRAASHVYVKALQLDSSKEVKERMLKAFLERAARFEERREFFSAVSAYTMAAQLLDDVESLRPHAVASAVRSGRMLVAQERFDHAFALFRGMLKVFEGDRELIAEIEATEKRVEERDTADRIFNAASAAHDKGDYKVARDCYKQLLEQGIFKYKGTNIGTLLAAAIDDTAPPRSPRPYTNERARQSVEDGPPRPARPSPRAEPLPVIEVQVAAPRRWPSLLGVTIALAALGFFLWLPARVVEITLQQPPKLKAGTTIPIVPGIRYGGGWRRGAVTPGPRDYLWRTSNAAVATVSGGEVKGVGPGEATISASYGGVTGTTQVTVVTAKPWDIVPLKASVKAVRFFEGNGKRIPEEPQRVYRTRFAWRSPRSVVAELTLDIDRTAPSRELTASIDYTIFRSDRSVAERGQSRLQLEQSWSEAKIPIPFAFTRGLTPDQYRIVFSEPGSERSIASGLFEVY